MDGEGGAGRTEDCFSGSSLVLDSAMIVLVNVEVVCSFCMSLSTTTYNHRCVIGRRVGGSRASLFLDLVGFHSDLVHSPLYHSTVFTVYLLFITACGRECIAY